MKKCLLIILLLSFVSRIDAEDNLQWLSVRNTHVEDSTGTRVILRGVNLGSWLVPELWMLPIRRSPPSSSFTKLKDQMDLWNTLEKRFGKEKMRKIRNAFRKSWITDSDFTNIKNLGFNSIRLPFLYDMLEEPDGFLWLDYAIDQAKKAGLYVILDLHGAPGRQSVNEHTGQVDQNYLFSDQNNWEKTAALWKTIALRYKDRPEVAGFDLLNEPMGARSTKELYKLQDKIYRRIRTVDSRHLIFIEDGYKGIKRMPHKSEYKWKNAVLSTHLYCFDKLSENQLSELFDKKVTKISAAYKKHQLPYYLGEFNVKPHGSNTVMKKLIATLHEKRIAYSMWSYKIAQRSGNSTPWAFYYADGSSSIDPFKDSYEKILKKIKALTTKKMKKNRALVEIFTK